MQKRKRSSGSRSTGRCLIRNNGLCNLLILRIFDDKCHLSLRSISLLPGFHFVSTDHHPWIWVYGLNANLLTVPVYLWGMFSNVIISFFSDRVQRRGLVIAGLTDCIENLPVGSIAFVIIWRNNSSRQHKPKNTIFGMLFLRYGDLSSTLRPHVAH